MIRRECLRREAHGRHFSMVGGKYVDCDGRATCDGCGQPAERAHLLACPVTHGDCRHPDGQCVSGAAPSGSSSKARS